MNTDEWYDGSCDLINSFNFISGKWRLPILWYLSHGNLRYNELRRHLCGITNIMLTRSLQDLEIHGMVWRKQLSNIPPHVVYGLTDQGKNIIPVLEVLEAWGETQVNFEKRND